MKAPLPWFGGKQMLADRIVALLPPHRVYCEPCGGAASVLCTKSRSHLEVYNDRDGDLVNFFRCLRDQPRELLRLLRHTPFSRDEWKQCVETRRQLEMGLERARRWYVAITQSFNANGGEHSWSGARLGLANVPTPERFRYRVRQLDRFAERIAGVQIDNLDWRDALERYDSPDTCFYIDPPYHPSTRASGGYEHEWTEEDHDDFLALLPTLAGSSIVSGYGCEPYDAALADWDRFEFSQLLRFNGKSDNQKRTEVVWRSPHTASQMSLLRERRLQA